MSYMSQDTIAAISTAVSESGIGIIRISGPDAIAAADLVYRSPGGKKRLTSVDSHTIHYGYICDEEGGVIDEVLVSVMKAPRTYTAEDTVEISCHGGVLSMKKVLDTVLHCSRIQERLWEEQNHREDCLKEQTYQRECLNDQTHRKECKEGQTSQEKKEYQNNKEIELKSHSHKIHVRAAEPGEFTKRAFLNGRIDLSRAEAVMDLIEAKNEFALRNSVSQVRGSLYHEIAKLRSGILYQIAHIEASLDDPEHLDFVPHIGELEESLEEWSEKINHLIETSEDGRLAAEGIKTVIVGKPNAGKSSLLNLLLGEDRAIVTDIAGTTRDLLTETINLQGITLLITDTAGIHDTDDAVERIGVERAERSIREADLLLWIVDSSVPLDENDRRISSLLPGRPSIVLLNKSDLSEVTGVENVRKMLGDSKSPILPFSAREKTGYDDLIQVLKDMFFHGKLSWNDEVVITNARHKALLEEARDSLGRVRESLEMGMSEDFFSIDLMSAYESLGKIIGEEAGEDLVNEIFSRFCMGK